MKGINALLRVKVLIHLSPAGFASFYALEAIHLSSLRDWNRTQDNIKGIEFTY